MIREARLWPASVMGESADGPFQRPQILTIDHLGWQVAMIPAQLALTPNPDDERFFQAIYRPAPEGSSSPPPVVAGTFSSRIAAGSDEDV